MKDGSDSMTTGFILMGVMVVCAYSGMPLIFYLCSVADLLTLLWDSKSVGVMYCLRRSHGFIGFWRTIVPSVL